MNHIKEFGFSQEKDNAEPARLLRMRGASPNLCFSESAEADRMTERGPAERSEVSQDSSETVPIPRRDGSMLLHVLEEFPPNIL